MRRKFKSSVWMLLVVFVFTVKVSAQAESLTKPQSEKRMMNLGSSAGIPTQESYGQEENSYAEYTQAGIPLQGKWDLYGTDLGNNHIWTGYIVIDRFGDVKGGKLKSSRPGDQYVITTGHFGLNVKTGKVKGYYTESEGETTNIEATMHDRSQISGVMINPSGSEEEGIFMLVRVSEDVVLAAEYIPYYFPLHQGDTWEYIVFSDDGEKNQGRIKIDGTEIVNGVKTKKRYELLHPDYQDENDYECVAQNSEGFVWYKKLGTKDVPPGKFWNPPAVYFPLKMRIGQSFTSYWLGARLTDAPNSTISGRTIELEGLETVTVPAGRFKDCLKIKYGQFDHEDGPSDHEVIKGWIWLARGVGIVKTVEYGAEYLPDEQKTDTETVTTELTRYKINNGIK